MANFRVVKMDKDKLAKNIKIINTYLETSNCSDFWLKSYNGYKLSLVSSFDLSYYHEIEINFYEVYKISMETNFMVEIGFKPKPMQSQCPFQLEMFDDDMIEIIITDEDNVKHSIICEAFDVVVDTVKYFDETGKLK